jgi:hypothetical protein
VWNDHVVQPRLVDHVTTPKFFIQTVNDFEVVQEANNSPSLSINLLCSRGITHTGLTLKLSVIHIRAVIQSALGGDSYIDMSTKLSTGYMPQCSGDLAAHSTLARAQDFNFTGLSWPLYFQDAAALEWEAGYPNSGHCLVGAG